LSFSETAEPILQEKGNSSFVLYAGLALSTCVAFFICAEKFLDWRRKRQEKIVLEDWKQDFLLEEDFTASSFSSLEDGIETAITIEETAEDLYSFKEDMNQEDINQEDINQKDINQVADEKISEKNEGNDKEFEMRGDSFSEELGFGQVYRLLNQALVNIDTAQIAAIPCTDEGCVTPRALPNLSEAIEVLDNLEALWGQSLVLDTLKEEVLKVMELKEGTPVLQTQDVAPDYFILQLCCRILLNMLQTGRYHIGKGILSNEGQELVKLFDRINVLRTQKAYSSYEEAKKDAAFLQFCVRELE
jgi:hypothetical protein